MTAPFRPPARRIALTALGALTLALAWPARALATTGPRGADDEAAEPASYGLREDVMRFADEVAQRQGFDAAWTRESLARARFVPAVARLIMPPPASVAKDWAAYRRRFVEPTRIRAGLEFWRDNERWLQLAQERWGVPPAIVVGIVGVETIYGRRTGSFRVLDALATLSFDFPSGRRDRTPFFRSELESFLLYCRQESLDPTEPLGSYAGAMGLPQFMPSSLLRYGIDFDEDGHVDLHRSPADVVGSVAHYLAQFGWERDVPTHFGVTAPVELRDRAPLLVPDIVPTFHRDEFAQRGALLDEAGRRWDGKLALIELANGDATPSYVAGTHNFYAITRYNWSSYYAMAVIELGEAIRHQRP
ncbi:lytic murein transglycosylase B [uncultured Piscinibacter sp.]|uniref:lytic murein transglycosylase B n=1 Tax=uncultured Piscinibacter sp. TaxID=1131835 RepID=UPI0026267368|nr:lytic murein transglycosylase B [uncultured Piscinibacter sp.]